MQPNWPDILILARGGCSSTPGALAGANVVLRVVKKLWSQLEGVRQTYPSHSAQYSSPRAQVPQSIMGGWLVNPGWLS